MSEITKFLVGVGESPGLWNAIDVRVVAARVNERWHNLYTYCLLRPEKVTEIELLQYPLDTPNLKSCQHLLSVDSLAALLEGVRAGQWPPENPVFYQNVLDGAGPPYVFNHYTFHWLDLAYQTPQFPWSAHFLSASAGGVAEILQRALIDHNALRSLAHGHRHPFLTFDHLVQYLTGRPQTSASNNNCFCEVVAPYPIRLNEEAIHLIDGTLSVEITCDAPHARERMRVRFATTPPDAMPLEKNLLADTSLWSEGVDRTWRWSSRFDMQEVDEVALFLSYGNQSLQTVTRRSYRHNGKSVPYALYHKMDPGLKRLRTALIGDPKKGDKGGEFHEAVGRLFTLAGFQVDVLRSEKLGDGVDIVCYAHDHRIALACECTTGAINSNGKIGKLIARCGSLSSAIEPLSLRPVLATSLKRKDIADEQTARTEGVRVLSQEDLLAMAHDVEEGKGIHAFVVRLTQ